MKFCNEVNPTRLTNVTKPVKGSVETLEPKMYR